MSGRPTVGWVLSLASGIIILPLGLLASGVLFLPVLISGVLLLAGGLMLYFRPASRSPWSVLVIVVAVADLAGIAYIFFAPGVGGVTLLGSLGPLLGLIGGVAGFLWKPEEARPLPPSTI